MPCFGAYTPLPRDTRLEGNGTAMTYTADAAWESGYRVNVTAGSKYANWGRLYSGGDSIVLGDGDSIWMTIEVYCPSATNWNPGVAEEIAVIVNGGVGPPNFGNTRFSIVRENVNAATFHAQLIDANGTAHATAAFSITQNTRTVLAARIKRYQSAGNWVVDVEIGTISGSTFTSGQVLTADIITGADKTVTFTATGGFYGCWWGHPAAYSKGGTGETDFGVMKVNVSANVVLTAAGNAWTQAAVDATNTRLIATAASQVVTACELITIYDTSASGDSWPTTTTVIDHRLPTSDQSPLQWTPDTPGTHYTRVNDAFGSYSATSKVTSNANGDGDEYGYPALSLAGKTVLCVGILAVGGGTFALDVIAALSAVQKPNYGFWNKMPVAAAGFAHSQVMQF